MGYTLYHDHILWDIFCTMTIFYGIYSIPWPYFMGYILYLDHILWDILYAMTIFYGIYSIPLLYFMGYILYLDHILWDILYTITIFLWDILYTMTIFNGIYFIQCTCTYFMGYTPYHVHAYIFFTIIHHIKGWHSLHFLCFQSSRVPPVINPWT